MKKTITIFGSSLPKSGDVEYETAYRLGGLLADCGFNICSGGYEGIMDAVSKGANEKGGEAIGITVNLWGSTPSKYLTKEIKCNSLFERITKLVNAGDGYVVLQGGTGTLLELAAVWELINKKLIEQKPAVCHSQMWNEIVSIMDRQILHEGRKNGLIKCFEDVEGIVEFLSTELIIKG